MIIFKRNACVFLFICAALVFASVLMSGCNTSYSECCPSGAGACTVTIDNVKYSLTCSGGACVDGPVYLTCASGNTFCTNSSGNVTSILVCGNFTSNPCTKNMCNAMVCGYTKYDPSPSMSIDDQYATSGKSDNNKKASMDSSLTSKVAVNLLGTSCQFKPLNAKTTSEIKSAKGSLWLNSFRFGVGESFSDFEESRYYFPISDSQCGITSGVKDRFTNYLGMKTSLGTCKAMPSPTGNYSFATCACNGCDAAGQQFNSYDTFEGGVTYLAACQRVCMGFNPTMCSSSSRQSTSNKIPFLNSRASYNFTTTQYIGQFYCGEDGNDKCSDSYGTCKSPWEGECKPGSGYLSDDYNAGGIISQSKEIYYKDILSRLQSEYSTEYLNGYYDSIGGGYRLGPPYSCEFSSECMSGLCNKNGPASMSVCTDNTTANKNQINCACAFDSTYKIGCYVDGSTVKVRYLAYGIVVADSSNWAVNPAWFLAYKAKSTLPYLNTENLLAPTKAELRATVPLIKECDIPDADIVISGQLPIDNYVPFTCEGNSLSPSPPPCWKFYPQYSTDYILAFNVTLKSTGKCTTTSAGKLSVRTLGVCEACTTATLTQQSVTLIGEQRPSSSYPWGMYCPIAVVSPNYPVDWGLSGYAESLRTTQRQCKLTEWDSCGGHNEDGRSCDCYGTDAGRYGCYGQRGWPSITPTPQYLREKLDTYLRSNVLPILNLQDSRLWYYGINYNVIPYSGPFGQGSRVEFTPDTSYKINDVLSKGDIPANMGAMIINVGIPNGATSTGSPNNNYASDADIILRAKGVKKHCPRCLVAVENPTRNLAPLDSLFQYNNNRTYGDAPGLVDLILNSFNPSEIATGSSPLCGNYKALLEYQTNYSRNLLQRYQKPSIVNRLNINESAIPDETIAYFRIKVFTETSHNGYWCTGESCNPTVNTVYSSGRSPLVDSVTHSTMGSAYIPMTVGTECGGSEIRSNGPISLYFYSGAITSISSIALTRIESQDVYADIPGVTNNADWSCGDPRYTWDVTGLNGAVSKINDWQYDQNGWAVRNTGGPGYLYFTFTVKYVPSISNACWSATNMEGMMEYMFNHTSDMVNAGTLAIIYDKWRTDWTGSKDGMGLVLNRGGNPDSKEDKFCSFQTNSRKALGLSTSTFFEKVYPKESCDCQECTDYDKALGKCDPICATGNWCKGYVLGASVKCPNSCYVASDCKLCSSLPGTFSCTYTYDDGTKKDSGPISKSAITSSTYQDVISALPNSLRCCIQEEQQDGSLINYTYVKTEVKRQKNTLDIFPREGSTLTDCNTDPTSLESTACGFTLPISKTKIDCK